MNIINKDELIKHCEDFNKSLVEKLLDEDNDLTKAWYRGQVLANDRILNKITLGLL